MQKNILPKLNASSKSISKTLEDIRLLLGLSEEEVATALSLLEKVDVGNLHFTRGNTDIRFQSYRSERSNCSDISVELEVREDDITRTIKYSLPRAIIRLAKRNKIRKRETNDKKVLNGEEE